MKPRSFTDTLPSVRKGKEDLSVWHLAVPYSGLPFQLSKSPPCTQFLSLCWSSRVDPKTCCHKKGTASLAQSVLQKEGSSSSSAMVLQVWWQELCCLLGCPADILLLTQGSHLGRAEALPKCVSFAEVLQGSLTRKHLFAEVTHYRNNTFLSYMPSPIQWQTRMI